MRRSWRFFLIPLFLTCSFARGHADSGFDGYWVEMAPPYRIGHTLAYDPAGERMLLVGGRPASGDYRNETWSLDLEGSLGWGLDVEKSVLPPRDLHTMVYDSARQRLLVYGGRNATHQGGSQPYLNDVWALDLSSNSGWQPIAAAGDTTPAIASTSAIYDPVRDRMLFFGGRDAFLYSSQLWSLDLSSDPPTWHNLPVNGTPPMERSSLVAIYDPVRDRMIVFGGIRITTRFNDVWALSLSGTPTWSQLTPAGTPPAPRSAASAIYDPVRDRMIVFGGSGNFNLNDLWALSLSGLPTWTQLTPTGSTPGQKTGQIAVYDPVHDEMVIHGSGNVFDETWRLALTDPPVWTQVTSSTPLPRTFHAAAYDPVRQATLVFGGTDNSVGDLNDLWELPSMNPATWQQLSPTGTPPLPRGGASAIYDVAGQRLLVFGGAGLVSGSTVRFNDTWQLPSSGAPAWSLVVSGGPSGRDGQSAIYDAARNRMLVWGGYSDGAVRNDLWSLSLGASPQWTLLSSATPPSARYRQAAIYDPVRDRMLLFGGDNFFGTNYNDLWELALSTMTWTQLVPLGSAPPPEEGHGAIYDPNRDRMLVQGNGSGEMWELTLSSPMVWRKLDAGGNQPGTREYLPLAYDSMLDRLVVFGGGPSGSGDTWFLTLGPTVGIERQPAGGSLFLAALGSNPIGGKVAVRYSLPSSGPARIDVFDVRGRRVSSVDASSSPGEHQVILAYASDWAQGVYWLRLSQGSVSTTTKAVVLR